MWNSFIFINWRLIQYESSLWWWHFCMIFYSLHRKFLYFHSEGPSWFWRRRKIHLKMLCGKLHPFFLGLNVLVDGVQWSHYTMMNSHQNASWWRHQMETFSVLLVLCVGNPPVPGEFPAQRPVMRSFDVFFGLRPNKWLSKQLCGWWFEMQLRSLWRHCNAHWHHIAWTWWYAMGHLLQFHCPICILLLQILFLYCCLCMSSYDCVMIHCAVKSSGPFQYKESMLPVWEILLWKS